MYLKTGAAPRAGGAARDSRCGGACDQGSMGTRGLRAIGYYRLDAPARRVRKSVPVRWRVRLSWCSASLGASRAGAGIASWGAAGRSSEARGRGAMPGRGPALAHSRLCHRTLTICSCTRPVRCVVCLVVFLFCVCCLSRFFRAYSNRRRGISFSTARSRALVARRGARRPRASRDRMPAPRPAPLGRRPAGGAGRGGLLGARCE